MKLQRKISLIADVSVSSNFTWERMVYNVQNCLSLLGFNCFMTDERFQIYHVRWNFSLIWLTDNFLPQN